MRFPALLAALTVLATVPYPYGDGMRHDPNSPSDLDPRLTQGAMNTEPEATPVKVGDRAPDFSYLGLDGRWSRFHGLNEQGPVLLVFGADEKALVKLQQDQPALVSLGVIPAAVTDQKGRGARAMGERLGLTFPLIPDSRGIVAGQFNSLDPATLHAVRAWFVVDRAGVVRALGRGTWPSRHWPLVASDALALPAPDAPRSAGSR